MTGNTKPDYLAILAKGALGAIPFVGSLAAEIVGNLIPNQRLDRISSLLFRLENRMSDIEKEKFSERARSPEGIDLLEDGFSLASRSIRHERLDFIASILKNGLTSDQIEYNVRKRVLQILSELSDQEIVILKSHTMNGYSEEDSAFFKMHEDVLFKKIVEGFDDFKGYVENELLDSYKYHMVQLGLLKQRYIKPKRGELPDFDEKTGKIKASGYSITDLGRYFLGEIGLISEKEGKE